MSSDRTGTDFNSKINPINEQYNEQLKISDMVHKIQSIFGLNTAQLAVVIGESRISLNSHIAGEELPVSVQAYSDLYDLALKVESEVSIPLKPGLKSALVNGKTLLAHLKGKARDDDKIIQVAKEVSKKILLSKAVALTPEQQRKASRRMSRLGV